jgi:hypothetical protein
MIGAISREKVVWLEAPTLGDCCPPEMIATEKEQAKPAAIIPARIRCAAMRFI